MYLGLGPFVRVGYMDMHLNLCEIRDIQDEIARRGEKRS
jgi:Fe-S-cluster formation regulator IscX/YfhJ